MITKEQKIRLLIDIKNGIIPEKALPIFKQPHFFCVSKNEKCINDVFFDELEFEQILDYLKKLGLLIWEEELQR